ncbi:MAG: ASCH domain-containing protein [Lachnospiraceae bacterium]|nr:ASCH domain-containing protein [Lachnospiraceae bacterium]
MELSGEKPEEYREIKPYWIIRILNWLGYEKSEEKAVMQMLKEGGTIKQREVLFQNGYSPHGPSFTAMCTLKIGMGYEEWGAMKGETYFIFRIHEILNYRNPKDWSH